MFAGAFALADRAVLRVLGEPGPVTYTPGVSGVAPVDIRGIFDSAYVKADAGHTGVTTSTPAVFILLADLPLDPKTDNWKTARVGVAGAMYRIKDARHDGRGGTVLELGEV